MLAVAALAGVLAASPAHAMLAKGKTDPVFLCNACEVFVDELEAGLMRTSSVRGEIGPRKIPYQKSEARCFDILEDMCHWLNDYDYYEPPINKLFLQNWRANMDMSAGGLPTHPSKEIPELFITCSQWTETHEDEICESGLLFLPWAERKAKVCKDIMGLCPPDHVHKRWSNMRSHPIYPGLHSRWKPDFEDYRDMYTSDDLAVLKKTKAFDKTENKPDL